jgi:hypothetical protein
LRACTLDIRATVPGGRSMPKRRANARRPSSFVLARVRGVLQTVRMPAMVVWGSASGPSTSLGATRRRRFGLLADSPHPRRTATEQTPQSALHHRPRQQPVLVGYGDDHRRSLPAVVAFQHPVREAPRVFVPDERYAVRPRRLPGPLEQQRGTRRGIYA